MAVREGWQGNFFEDFEVGDVYRSSVGRTVTEADNSWFTLLTNNGNQMYFNAEYARRTRFERPLVNSALTLALVSGLTVSDVIRNGVALGWKEVRFPNQMYVGDTLYAETEVLLARDVPSDPRRGLVKVRMRGIKQDGVVVMDSERNVLVWKRGHAPTTNYFPTVREDQK